MRHASLLHCFAEEKREEKSDELLFYSPNLRDKWERNPNWLPGSLTEQWIKVCGISVEHMQYSLAVYHRKFVRK